MEETGGLKWAIINGLKKPAEQLSVPLTEKMFQDFISEMLEKTAKGPRRPIKFEAGLGFIKNVHAGSGSDLEFLMAMQEGLCDAPADAWEYIFDVAIKVFPGKGPKFYVDLFPKVPIYLTKKAIKKFGWT